MFSPLLLLLSFIVGIATSSSSLSTYQSLQQQYYELLASYEDDDINSPPGPINGWPHTQPYTTNYNDLVSYNKLLEQRMYVTYQQEYFAIYGSGNSNENEDMLHISQIARPEGSTTGYYTGVTHFQHVNNKNLITFLFSAGRHDGGTNTYFTIDTTEEKNPFRGVQELYIDEMDVSTWTWVSSYTVINEDEDKVYHYALFSGGNGGGKVGPSKLYIFQEDDNGQLMLPPTVEWIEDISAINGAARFCLLTDLGNIYNTNKKEEIELVSSKGMPDIIISGTGGLYIYSKQQQQQQQQQGDWKLVRSISIDKDLNDDTSAFVGLEYMQDERHLVIAARTKWSNRGKEFTAPTLIYDYQNDKIVQELSSNGQTVSVALVDDKSRLLVSAGGQSGYTGQPNLMFDVSYIDSIEGADMEEVVVEVHNTTDQPWRGRFLKQIDQHQRRNRADSMIITWNEEESESSLLTPFQAESEKDVQGLQPSYSKATLELSDTQLVRDMPVDYTTFDYIDPVPVSSEDYFVIPSPGKTRTRQVLPFQLTNNNDQNTTDTSVDLILEINSAQTCNIYYRTMANETATKIMPLPGSEGRNNQDEYYYTRAGDALVIGDQLYIILAQYNGNNTVYSFSTSVF